MPSGFGDAMKRHSRAGGEPIKGQRRKTPEPKSRNAPKAPPARSNLSVGREETEVARLRPELNEAREQQTATGDVLTSHQPFELRSAGRARHAGCGLLDLSGGMNYHNQLVAT